MLFYAIISSVVYLRCRMQFSAKPMNKKGFGAVYSPTEDETAPNGLPLELFVF